jgi:hypothetical protein
VEICHSKTKIHKRWRFSSQKSLREKYMSSRLGSRRLDVRRQYEHAGRKSNRHWSRINADIAKRWTNKVHGSTYQKYTQRIATNRRRSSSKDRRHALTTLGCIDKSAALHGGKTRRPADRRVGTASPQDRPKAWRDINTCRWCSVHRLIEDPAGRQETQGSKAHHEAEIFK